MISPLKALNYLIESLESDIVVMDYAARLHPRHQRAEALHRPQDQLDGTILVKNVKSRWMLDVNVYQENLFPRKMHLKEFGPRPVLVRGEGARNLSFKERMKIEARLKREIEELYHRRNLVD